MRIEDYQQQVIIRLPELLPENIDLLARTIKKTNDVCLHGIEIKTENNVSPVIYIDSSYEKYDEGNISFADSVSEIAAQVKSAIQNTPDKYADVTSWIDNYEEVREKIVMSVVNTERNKDYLSDKPHMDKEDLSVVYKVKLDKEGYIAISNSLTENWGGISVEQLHEIAEENQKKLSSIKVISMSDTLKELGAEFPDFLLPDPKQEQYVLTNADKSFGAIAMFDKDALSSVAEKVESDLYILPSSIHEVLVVSSDFYDLNDVKNMVKEVNDTVVSENEILSYNVYRFDSKTKELTIADDKAIKKTEDNTQTQRRAAAR